MENEQEEKEVGYTWGPSGGGVSPVKSSGTATLSGGTVTVNDVKATTGALIILTAQSGTLNLGSIGVSTRVDGVSFTMLSTNVLDARTVGYLIF